MKILSIYWGFSRGGIASYSAMLQRICDFSNVSLVNVCIVVSGRDIDMVSLHKIDPVIVKIRSLADVSWIVSIRALLKSCNPDCILSHGFNGHLVSLVCGIVSKGNFFRLATYHGEYYSSKASKKIIEYIYNCFTIWFVRHVVTSVVCVSDYSKDCLINKGVLSDKIYVIHNGIHDVSINTSIRKEKMLEWGFSSENFIIGVVSRLDRIKGVGFLIDAFLRVIAKFSCARLVIIGDGPERIALEERVRNLGIAEKVLFTGMRDDVAFCLVAFDVFVLPSLAENHSIALLEAMRAGLPIIATQVGGNTESIRDGVDGLIVEPENSSCLYGALMHMIGDGELRYRLGTSARKRFCGKFTDDVMIKSTLRWIYSVFGCVK